MVPSPNNPESTSGDRGPTARRIVLGSHLRKLRERAGIKRTDAAYEIRGSDSKMSRLESGKVGFKKRDVSDLLTLYGVGPGPERDNVLSMTDESNESGWWARYNDVVPGWFEDFVGLESSASRISSYELLFVPGLLQTEAYARAVVSGGHADLPPTERADVEKRLEVRMRRQRVLHRKDAPTLWAVLDESLLHRPVGGRAVHKAQLQYLLELSALPNVIVQLLPWELSGYGAEHAFSMLRFAEPELPDLVYLEEMTGSSYLDKRADVERYGRAMDRLTVDALSPDRTKQAISGAIADR
ncbi:helix-turn-helix domain-containing protein [Pseudonocardia sp. HH130630-07]|uniref:helix-turn-helix domain-containing protein n=1 Tax=Pseudonocardia sp. HH130630-07 TaxID=1690815 RepID=UPI000815245A|nr:helix-turn-helix transcriptional regulator [Pseudonocardia sp. HH130630-07]ANY09689.1 XRE family transcriptional regulator [Pseudonocardia sp. HH130630-07]